MFSIILAFLALTLVAPKNDSDLIQGAWQTFYAAENGEQRTVVAIVKDGYIAETEYAVESGRFIWAIGGSWTIDGDIFHLNYEFSSADSSLVGTTLDLPFVLEKDEIKFPSDTRKWMRIDDGRKGDLKGAWLITGRERNGEMTRRTPGSRKTMKILSGTRFQWVAYDIDSKSFKGSGGGTYTAVDGKYTETIEFFSRDDKRVGASLPFEYEVKKGEWHHSGLSSKGDPIHEVWTLRKEIENQ